MPAAQALGSGTELTSTAAWLLAGLGGRSRHPKGLFELHFLGSLTAWRLFWSLSLPPDWQRHQVLFQALQSLGAYAGCRCLGGKAQGQAEVADCTDIGGFQTQSQAH